jgi:hypothetical protein
VRGAGGSGVLEQGVRGQPWQMLGGLVRLLLYRFLGARIMLALAVFGWLRRALGGRRRTGLGYQPSQGESQTVQREPR